MRLVLWLSVSIRRKQRTIPLTWYMYWLSVRSISMRQYPGLVVYKQCQQTVPWILSQWLNVQPCPSEINSAVWLISKKILILSQSNAAGRITDVSVDTYPLILAVLAWQAFMLIGRNISKWQGIWWDKYCNFTRIKFNVPHSQHLIS